MDAAVAALVGAAIGSTIGAAGVVGSAWVQQHQQTRREIARTAADLAIADFAHEMTRKLQSGGSIAPMSAYVAYHAAVLRAVAAGRFGPDTVKAITAEQDALLTAIHEISKRDRTRS